MTAAVPPAGRSPAESPDARLREAARALEGVFVAQLYKAMRASVPESGLLDGGAGQDIFTEMFDEQMADILAQRLEGSLGDQLYAQLRRQFSDASGEGA